MRDFFLACRKIFFIKIHYIKQVFIYPGDLQFPAMRRLSIATAHAFLLVYASSSLPSFECVKRCFEEVREQRPDFQVRLIQIYSLVIHFKKFIKYSVVTNFSNYQLRFKVNFRLICGRVWTVNLLFSVFFLYIRTISESDEKASYWNFLIRSHKLRFAGTR